MQPIHNASHAEVRRAEFGDPVRGEKAPNEPGTSSPLAMALSSDATTSHNS